MLFNSGRLKKNGSFHPLSLNVGTSDRSHSSGYGAADPKTAARNSAGRNRVWQPAAAHNRHLHQRRHLCKPAAMEILFMLVDSLKIVKNKLAISLCVCLSSRQAGKNWMFNNAKSPPHCELMTSHLRNRITVDGAHFELRLHLIYLTNDVLHHWYTNPIHTVHKDTDHSTPAPPSRECSRAPIRLWLT